MSASISTIQRLAAEWQATDRELDALWRRNSKPHGKAWKKISAPLWDRQETIEGKLGPLLFKYAERKDLGKHGHNYWHPERNCYQRLRAAIGADIKSHTLRRLIRLGWWETRGKAAHEASEKAYAKMVRSMNDKQWSEYVGNYCASSPEGRGTKELLIKLRAAYDAERDKRQAA